MSSIKPEWSKAATGEALVTVQKHAEEQSLKLFGSWFCPFVQRVWIALELKGIPYQYIEINPYDKPPELMEINHLGLVPALRHGPTWSTHESSVLLDYIEELLPGLLPAPGTGENFQAQAQARADARRWADFASRSITPAFYRALQAQDPNEQAKLAGELAEKLEKLVRAADPEGPSFSGKTFGWVDAYIAPWILRFRRVLKPYRAWPDPEPGSRLEKWTAAIEAHPAVKATTSDDSNYIDSYRRYAENRPNTSQVAEAINKGRGLP
jgi:glutathione S-transferase